MLYTLSLQLRRMILPMLAILVGASFAAQIDRSECQTYVSAMNGNDPTAVATLELCRLGHSYQGTLLVKGKSGGSIASVEGYDLCHNNLRLVDSGVQVAAANEGWQFCFDDVYELHWQGDHLVGQFHSEECNDHGKVDFAPRL